MIKNKHLLAIIAGLGGLTALLCLVLIFSEKANASRLDTLARELSEYRHRQDERETALKATIADLSGKLAATEQRLRTAEIKVEQTSKGVVESRSLLDMLLRKKWLTAEGDGPPWDKEVTALDKRVTYLEGTHKPKLVPPMP
jgi:septal ring factor EnvC (AmiA/AmiB activator)